MHTWGEDLEFPHRTCAPDTTMSHREGHVNTCRSLRKLLCRVTTPGALIGPLLPPDIWVHGGSCHHSTTPGMGYGVLLIPRMTEVKFHSGTSRYTLESDFLKIIFTLLNLTTILSPYSRFSVDTKNRILSIFNLPHT